MPRRVLNRVYDKEYFSGTQAALYIGDVFVDEVTSYAFTVSQQKVPIYGYASQLFDDVSKGHVLVNGNFAINFKESGYLYLVLDRYRKLMEDIRRIESSGKFTGPNTFTVTTPEAGSVRVLSPFKSDENKILRADIERILFKRDLGNEEYFEFLNSLAQHATFDVPEEEANDLTFENWAENFEDKVWGTPSKELEKEPRRVDDEIFNGFDMYFVYGDFNYDEANHTVERISNIYLTRKNKAVNISGEPIQEEYEFFARNSF